MKRSTTVASCPTASTNPVGMARIAAIYPRNSAQPFQLVGTPAPIPFSFGRNQYSVMSDASEDEVYGTDDVIAPVFKIRDSFVQCGGRDNANVGHVYDVASVPNGYLRHQALKQGHGPGCDQGRNDAR